MSISLSPNAFSPWLVASVVCRELPAWLRCLFCPRCRVAGTAGCRCSAAPLFRCHGLYFTPLGRGCFQQEHKRPTGHVPWRSAAHLGSLLAPMAAHRLLELITQGELPGCTSDGLWVICNELAIIMLSVMSSAGIGEPHWGYSWTGTARCIS